jgi:hypothetical protein
MFRTRVLVGLIVAAFMCSAFVSGDEPPKKDPPPPKVKGTLPQGWSKLGLTDQQKQDVYRTEAEYRAKIDVLEAQIKDLRKQRNAALQKILTEGQKTRLKEILAEKAGGETSSKDEKKPDKDKNDKKPEKIPDPKNP